MRAILCYGGPDRKIIDERGKLWHFEMHPWCGPMPTDKRGEPLKKQPPEKASFWRVVSLWAQQGKQIDADGVCVWKKLPEPKLIHLGGRHYRVVNEADAASTK